MFRDNRGYLLIDSVYGFLIILLLCVSLVPLAMHIFKERQAINNENHAIELLKQQSILYRETGMAAAHEDKKSGMRSYLSVENQIKSLCVEWPDIHGRAREKCLEVF